MNNVSLSTDGTSVVILDQTKLPNTLEYLTLSTAKQMYDAIFELKVRGAPAIGICAGFSIFCLAQTITAIDYDEFLHKFREYIDFLNSARPTAVNLSWALKRMEKVVLEAKGKKIDEILSLLKEECLAIKEEDTKICRTISEYGLEFLKDGDGVLTHCNAGPLATSQYGTALGPLILGRERGMNLKVFVDETRPLLQGARLTAFELLEAGIDTTLICDNMASIVMKQGLIKACFVGCDRVAKNGDTANKIGTSGVAILAKYYGIPLYVMCPTSTIDLNCDSGEDIHIELRSEEEIKSMWYEKPMAPERVKCYNPAFDVTDHTLIHAIITEHGICRSPFEDSLKKAVQQAQK